MLVESMPGGETETETETQAVPHPVEQHFMFPGHEESYRQNWEQLSFPVD